MYYTHHFASRATLDRARSWLLELGFPPSSIEAHTSGIPRLSVAVEAARVPEVELVIDALEQSDPHGWPSLWDVARQVQVERVHAEDTARPRPRRSESIAIGWHPFDARSAATPDLDSVSESMSRKWGWA